MKFPKKIKYRGRVLAKIYGKTKNYPFYRLAYYVAGKRSVQSFRTYSEAKSKGDEKAKEIYEGSQAAALNGPQSRDALAALQSLEAFYQRTGRRVSLLGAVSEFVEAAGKLNGFALREAVEGYLRTVATVQRKDIKLAVEDFIKANAPLARATEGQRSQLSAKYAYNREIQLRRFAGTFPNTAVCDLSKELLGTFFGSLEDFSAKSRNHYRATVRQFLEWAVRKDYLSSTHRLGEAEEMRPERANTSEVSFYTPKEFADLLAAAEGNLRAMIAIGGLAGLRTTELLRLDWSDVWRVPNHIEITARKSKTRQRRLVEICPALAAWLKPFRNHTSGKLWEFHEITFHEQFGNLCRKEGKASESEPSKSAEKSGSTGPIRKPNGLRHAFCTYHFALHSNENLTAAQAGNSPAMIHAHYKGLATKSEANDWFNVKPKRSGSSKASLKIIALPKSAVA